MTKTDAELGKQVHHHLLNLGIETPMHDTMISEDNDKKIASIQRNFQEILETLGMNMIDDSLVDTPARMAKMYVKELFWGLNYDNFPKCTTVDNKIHYDELVIEKATVKSTCEHHLVYLGTAHNPKELGCWVAYMPNRKVLGLSKLNRIVSFFSHRPQIQERLTLQIAEALKYILGTDNVAVVIRAQHFCVLTRGVEDSDSFTVTSSIHGRFKTNHDLKQELMSLVNRV